MEANTSLAWWQVDPNLNHLWSTTCPGDPNWSPGAGRSSGWNINPALEGNAYGYGNESDTIHMPLYPRHKVRPVCQEALKGELFVADTVHWRGVHGRFTLRSEALVTGESIRDVMMHQMLESSRFPEIVFKLDSADLVKRGDTLVGSGVGTLTVRDQATAVVAAVKAWAVPGGMRVLAKWHFPADHLYTLAPSLHTLGLGLNTRLWQTFFMGADVVLRPEGSAAK